MRNKQPNAGQNRSVRNKEGIKRTQCKSRMANVNVGRWEGSEGGEHLLSILAVICSLSYLVASGFMLF